MHTGGNCSEDGRLGIHSGAGQAEDEGQTGQVETAPVEKHEDVREHSTRSGVSRRSG